MSKRVIALLALFGALFFFMGAFAAHHGDAADPEQGKAMHKKMSAGYFAAKLERIDREVVLTPEQKSKLKSVFEDADQRVRQIHVEVHAKLKAVLSREQFEKLEALQAKWHGSEHGHPHGMKEEPVKRDESHGTEPKSEAPKSGY